MSRALSWGGSLPGCVINKERPEFLPTSRIYVIADQAGRVLDYIEGKTDSLPGVWEDLKPVSRVNRLLNAVDPIQPVWADMGGAHFTADG